MRGLAAHDVRCRSTARFLIWVTDLTANLSAYTCEGAIRALAPGTDAVDPDAAIVARFGVTAFEGDGTRGEGFILELTSAQTGALTPGTRYLADAIVTIGGEPFYTRSWIIEAVEPASVPA